MRRVVCAANRDPFSGGIIIGVRHWDDLMRKQAEVFAWARCGDEEQGFIDQRGIFMSRQEAWKVAEAAGQIIKRVGGDDAGGGTLYSENLY